MLAGRGFSLLRIFFVVTFFFPLERKKTGGNGKEKPLLAGYTFESSSVNKDVRSMRLSAVQALYKTLHEMTPEYPRSRFVFREDRHHILSRLKGAEMGLFHSPVPTIAEPGCGTAYPMIFDQ